MKPPKPKKCKICKEQFLPQRALQTICSIQCSIEYASRKKAQKQRIERREAKEKAKTRGQWLKEAQAAFNAFIRARDKDKPCVSCGRFHEGQYHAGHYRATSVAPALRFNEENVHKQCAPCNNHKHGNLLEYRIRLINRIGGELVEWLEGNHPPAKYSVHDLKEIKSKYSKMARDIGNKYFRPEHPG